MKRREFIRTGLLTTAAVGALGRGALAEDAGRSEAGDSCNVAQKGSEVELHGPAFAFTLDLSKGLGTRSWQNRLSGRTIELAGNAELDIELDAADERISIPGWTQTVSHAITSDFNHDPGYREGYAQPHYDDSKWQKTVSLVSGEESPSSFTWGRTLVAIPASARDKPLSLTLGGFGLFDHRFMRVFVNGNEAGMRRTTGRWNEPMTVDLGPDSSAHHSVRFGQDNLIAVQLSEFVTRTARLDELDPRHSQNIPNAMDWPLIPVCFEQYLTVGPLPRRVEWEPARLVSTRSGPVGEAVFELKPAAAGLSALVTYRWNSQEPVLHKFVEISNRGAGTVKVLNVSLGSYKCDTAVTDGEQGFPVYLDAQFFVSLAHPYGWAMGQERTIRLWQYPAAKLSAGESFQCMETVYGVASERGAQRQFVSHVRGRIRRVVQGHDKPYAIFDPFGGQPRANHNVEDDNSESEEYLLDNIAKVAQGQQECGCHFDHYSLEFWVDYHGDLTQADPKRFPRGLEKIKSELKKLNTALGLWIDSSWQEWSIGGNPAVLPDYSSDLKYTRAGGGGFPGGVGVSDWESLCRASEPIKSMYSRAFRYHIRENGVRLLKFDNFHPLCYNPRHEHLPGVYSMEAIGNAVIGFFHDLDAESHDVFLMLYWGYKSPWWLMHADTLFESGLFMEASFASSASSLHIRNSVTVGLDQAQWYCADIPRLGKDSLGVWLSDWGWNSSAGSGRWQEAFVMDMCRGSLLAQPWSDNSWLTLPGRQQMADFIALLKERPDCFSNPSFIVGSPWKNEPYGYACSNGERAFIALNNRTWKDAPVALDLSAPWGLLGATACDLYRWYPNPAQLTHEARASAQPVLFMRPFEVILLEVVPGGAAPSLGRKFLPEPIPGGFKEPSRELEVETSGTAIGLAIKGQLPPCGSGGTLAIEVRLTKQSLAFRTGDVGKNLDARGQLAGKDVECLPVVAKSLAGPACWQVWRVVVDASPEPRAFEFLLTSRFEKDVALTATAHFVPR